jgi:arylsulfatase A-like enzyme
MHHRTRLLALEAPALLALGFAFLGGCDGAPESTTDGGGGSTTTSATGGGGSVSTSTTSDTTTTTDTTSSSGGGGAGGCIEPSPGGAAAKQVILFVWDGLRPDSINAADTPHLAQLAKEGVSFEDNHATYPTFTMMNAASFATGAFPGTTGFYGNTLWAPGAMGKDSGGNTVDFQQPVFTEDYAILQDLDAFYDNQLLLVGTLFAAAQTAGLKTAAIGKTGPAFLQDYKKGGVILDERIAYPLSFAQELQAASYKLPKRTPLAYLPGEITLDAMNGDPTASKPGVYLADGSTSDPTDSGGAQPTEANAYLTQIFLDYVLPVKKPDLSLLWLRSPDIPEHIYGVGVANHKAALKAQDDLLGLLEDKLVALGIAATTDIIVVSDHGHSNVSGPLSLFPLRGIANGNVTTADPAGYSVSGDVRIADLLTRAGFTAFDGMGCTYDPVMSGIEGNGATVYSTQSDDDAGTVCGASGKKYITPSYKVPATLPPGAVVVSVNGGSEYLYVPSKDKAQIQSLVSFLQTREEVGAIFVASAYQPIAGTLPLDQIRVESTATRTPDIIFSYEFDEAAMVQGMPGTEFSSAYGARGMHGSFSPIDVHNTLVARGPDFRQAFTDTLPTGNIDVAPTLAFLLNLSLDKADGRPLYEALQNGLAVSDFEVDSKVVSSDKVTGLSMKLPTSPTGADIDAAKSSYQIDLHTKTLSYCGNSRTYFDKAKAVR